MPGDVPSRARPTTRPDAATMQKQAPAITLKRAAAGARSARDPRRYTARPNSPPIQMVAASTCTTRLVVAVSGTPVCAE